MCPCDYVRQARKHTRALRHAAAEVVSISIISPQTGCAGDYDCKYKWKQGSLFPQKNRVFSKTQYSGFELFLGSDVKKTETGLKSIIVGMGLVSRSLETTPYDKLD